MFAEKITSVEGLQNAAEKLIAKFPDHRIFAFYGKMGAGKTTFIKALCKSLGTSDNVTSPTFALINEYNAADLSSIFHFDFYRIENIEEAYDLGYEDYLYSGNYCFIEWPEKIEPLLPDKFIEVKIKVDDNEIRKISGRII